MVGKNIARFILTFYLGWFGSFIINHSGLKPDGYTCRTTSYFFWSYLTCGIYQLVASLCNLGFNPEKGKIIGYYKE